MARFVKDGMLSGWQIQPRPENSDEHAISAPSDISYGDNQAGQLVGIALGRIEAGQLKSALLAPGLCNQANPLTPYPA